MSKVKFETLKTFGEIHKNKKRIIVVTLTQSSTDENVRRYISFHEHFLAEDGKLHPMKKDYVNPKFPNDKVVSFTLTASELLAKDLRNVMKNLAEYLESKPEPMNEEDPF